MKVVYLTFCAFYAQKTSKWKSFIYAFYTHKEHLSESRLFMLFMLVKFSRKKKIVLITSFTILLPTSTKFALNKRTLEKNPFPLVRMNSIWWKIRLYYPKKLLPLLGTENIEENWFTPNFSNAFQQQKKKLWIKAHGFEINPKSVYTSRDEEFDENSVPLAGKSCFH